MMTDADSPPTAPEGPEAPKSLDADGRLRPAFLLELPDAPELAPLVEAFERGDYRFVRKHSALVLAQQLTPDVRRAVLELRKRIEPDPLMLLFLASTVAFFLLLVAWSYR